MSLEEKKALERRTKEFALKAIVCVSALPRTKVADVLGGQFIKAATSIGANYREANRAESRNDFIHKIGVVEKEAAESVYWLELLDESKLGSETLRVELLREASELLAIFSRIGKTAKLRRSAANSI
jgi:four helix bundle protein